MSYLLHSNLYFFCSPSLVDVAGRAVIKSVPTAAVDGILVFVGLAGLFDTQLYARLWLLFTEEARHPRDKLFTRVRKVRGEWSVFLYREMPMPMPQKNDAPTSTRKKSGRRPATRKKIEKNQVWLKRKFRL